MTKREIQTLFMAHYTQMYRLALTILYDDEESKDAVSEVFARLLDGNLTLRQETAGAYLLTATRNYCRSILEHKQMRERILRQLSAEAGQPAIAEGEQQRMDEVTKFIRRQLPPLSQQIVRLRFLEEMTCQEVAAALGISRQTVHTHLRQAMEQFRAFFKSKKH